MLLWLQLPGNVCLSATGLDFCPIGLLATEMTCTPRSRRGPLERTTKPIATPYCRSFCSRDLGTIRPPRPLGLKWRLTWPAMIYSRHGVFNATTTLLS